MFKLDFSLKSLLHVYHARLKAGRLKPWSTSDYIAKSEALPATNLLFPG
jgi:hypothetical protein